MTRVFATIAALLMTVQGAAQSVAVLESRAEDELQNRVNALAQQIHLRYQHHPPSLAPRRAAVEHSLAEWNRVAGRGGEEVTSLNQELMSQWLADALGSVMPGGSGTLPAIPEFIEAREEVTAVTPDPAPEPVEQESAPEAAVSVGPSIGPAFQPQPDSRAPTPAEQAVESRPGSHSVAKPATTFEAPRRSKWSRHPSAAPLEWRDPFVDDPDASPNPLRSGARHESLRPTFSSRSRVGVNLTELAAELRGYNAALRELQSVALTLEAADIERLSTAVDDLERLDQRRQFLDLYREGLNDDARRSLPVSPSIELVRELVRRKVATLRTHVESGDPSDRRELDRISDRLAALAAS